jgi:hypothetical protein
MKKEIPMARNMARNAFDTRRGNVFLRHPIRFALGGFFALAAAGIAADAAFSFNTVENVTFTVTKAERVTYQNGDDTSSKYLVWTTRAGGEKEVFEDTDTLWFGKFNSSDIYGDLKTCHTFNAKVNGWRVPWASAYRNILSIEDVTGKTGAVLPQECAAPAPGR